MAMSLRARLKRLLPADAYNSLMLSFPALYRLPMVRFESNMDRAGIGDITQLLDDTESLHGEVVECGSSRCGTTILIAEHLSEGGGRKEDIRLG